MALKKLVDVGEAFPIKKPRLGAAPPPADTLNNIGAREQGAPHPAIEAQASALVQSSSRAEPVAAPRTLERPRGGDGRGIHTGKGIDARRQIKTGRTYQFGARTTVAFADEVKRIAADKGITIGELLEEMLDGYRNVK